MSRALLHALPRGPACGKGASSVHERGQKGGVDFAPIRRRDRRPQLEAQSRSELFGWTQALWKSGVERALVFLFDQDREKKQTKANSNS